MKKLGIYFLILLLSTMVFLFGFSHKTSRQPHTYYNVYLDGEFVGTIESRKELEEYINNQASTIRDNVKKYSLELDSIETFSRYNNLINLDEYSYVDKVNYLITNRDLYNLSDMDIENLKLYIEKRLYELSFSRISEMRDYVEKNNIYGHVENVYTPNGIDIKKIYTYNLETTPVTEIYKRIISKKTCTIAGYKFIIKSKMEGIDDIVINTIDKNTFSDAIEALITIFVDDTKYLAYKNDTQSDITTTGSLVENIYVDEDIHIRLQIYQ